MTKTWVKKLNSFVKKHLTKVLLLAVLLTGVFSMRNIAYGKYVDYLADYSQAVAEDFHFTSDALKSADIQKKYNIGTWITSTVYEYKLSLEIRNYDNALLWNEANTNLFYYLDAQIYNEAALSTKAANLTVTYTYEPGAIVGKYTDSEGIEHDVACIQGMSTFEKEDGLHKNSITVNYPTDMAQAPGIKYMQVKAVSIPYSEIGKIALNSGVDSGIIDNCKGNIYYSELSAVYNLGVGSSGGIFNHDIEQENNEYLVRLYLRSGFTTKVKIYYNPTVLFYSGETSTESVGGAEAACFTTDDFRMEKIIQFFKQGGYLNKEIVYAVDKDESGQFANVMTLNEAVSRMNTPVSERTADIVYPDIFFAIPNPNEE